MAARIKKSKKERIYAAQFSDPEHLTRPVMRNAFFVDSEDEEEPKGIIDNDSPGKEPVVSLPPADVKSGEQ